MNKEQYLKNAELAFEMFDKMEGLDLPSKRHVHMILSEILNREESEYYSKMNKGMYELQAVPSIPGPLV